MITNINKWKNTINENNRKTVFLTKNYDDKLEYQIFRDTNDGNMQIEKGTVGDKYTITTAPISTWDDKLRHAKTRRYIEVNNLDIKHVGTKSELGDGSFNLSVSGDYGKKTLDLLKSVDKHKIDLNTVLSSDNGTIKILSTELVERYKSLLDDLKMYSDSNDLTMFNKVLVSIGSILKKKGSIFSYLAKPNDNLKDKYEYELELFNTYLSINYDDYQKIETKSIRDIIDSNVTLSKIDQMPDLEITEIDNNDKQIIMDLLNLSNEGYRYINALKITNTKTDKAFHDELNKSDNKEVKYLFHGSKVANWLSIIKNGLYASYAGTNAGTLYDKGIYFADIADKSLGYVDGGRWDDGSKHTHAFLAVYEVHTGNAATYKDIESDERKKRVNLFKWVPDHNFDSYWAKSANFHPYSEKDKRYNLARDEFIVYKNNKCTIKYLVEVKL